MTVNATEEVPDVCLPALNASLMTDDGTAFLELLAGPRCPERGMSSELDPSTLGTAWFWRWKNTAAELKRRDRKWGQKASSMSAH